MVCFQIQIVFPKEERARTNAALDSRVRHILKHNLASIVKTEDTATTLEYVVAVCDESTVDLLRDLPIPFLVKRIDIPRRNQTLYLYKKNLQPPQMTLYKDVYWSAKQAERWWQ